jgi:hypothetical protein
MPLMNIRGTKGLSLTPTVNFKTSVSCYSIGLSSNLLSELVLEMVLV